MANNLRAELINGEMYINVLDLLKTMLEIMRVEGLQPEAIKAIDGLGIGLAISLGLVKREDLPTDLIQLIGDKTNARS